MLFLAILVIRVYWLDGFRARRANRAEFTPPPDHIVLFEWLVPSHSIHGALSMLMVAQSMMFSTIYRAAQQRDRHQQQQSTDSENKGQTGESQSRIDSLNTATFKRVYPSSVLCSLRVCEYKRKLISMSASSDRSAAPSASHPAGCRFKFGYSSRSNLMFFPKDALGREVNAQVV